MGATFGAGSANSSGAPEITPSFWWGSCCLFFSFICCVMCTNVCLFVLFICSHGVVSLFSIYEFDCPSGIFRPSSCRLVLSPYESLFIHELLLNNEMIQALLPSFSYNYKDIMFSYCIIQRLMTMIIAFIPPNLMQRMM